MTPDGYIYLLNTYLPEPHASLLNGILFGTPVRTSPVFYLQLQRVGLLHLVVLSGMNIAIIGNVFSCIFGFLPKKVALCSSIAGIILFTLFVGPQPPIIRAAIMGCLSLIATCVGKKATALIGLLTATLVIALFKPDWIGGISYQLSAGATLGIILFGSVANHKPATRFMQVYHFIHDELKTTASASLFTVPLIFIYFRQISVIAPIANIAVSWTIAPLMLLGAVTVFLGSINHFLGSITAYICYGLLGYMIIVIEFFSRIPFAFHQF